MIYLKWPEMLNVPGGLIIISSLDPVSGNSGLMEYEIGRMLRRCDSLCDLVWLENTTGTRTGFVVRSPLLTSDRKICESLFT